LLIARAHKWRKTWVAPNGTQPESTYKVCRWVKIAKDDKVRLSPFNNLANDEVELMIRISKTKLLKMVMKKRKGMKKKVKTRARAKEKEKERVKM